MQNERRRRRLAEEELAPTRTSLLSRLKSLEDDTSWQEFFDLYWKLIYSVARRSGLHDADAREVVQETVISLSRSLPQFQYDRRKGSFRSWMYRQTHWRVLDHLRRQKRREAAIMPASGSNTQLIESVPDPACGLSESRWDEEWEQNLFDLALQRIRKNVSPKLYQIFDLYVVRELPVSDVMATLNVTRTQVYLTKHRFTKALRKEVERVRSELEGKITK